MALLFMDSFDHYVTADLTEKWSSLTFTGGGISSPTISAGNGRHSSASFRATFSSSSGMSSYVSKSLSPIGPTCVIGCGFRTNATPNAISGTAILAIYDGGTPQLTLSLQSDFRLLVKRGTNDAGVVIGTSSTTGISAGIYNFIEFKATIDPTAGAIEVRINGVAVIPPTTSLNTRNTANTIWNAVHVGIDPTSNAITGSTQYVEFDDLYVLDGNGGAPHNTFLGDCRVDALYPVATGATTGWTPTAGTNYGCVSQTAPNDDTDYNYSSTVGAIDTFITANAPTAGVLVYGVQHCLSMKKADAGVCIVAPVIRHSGADNVGTDMAPSTAYSYGCQIAAGPAPATAWTEANFNAAEFGYKRTL